MRKTLALITMAVALAALVLQFSLIVDTNRAEGHGLGFSIWRFFGFFTILTDTGVAAVAGAMALRPDGWLAGPRTRLAAVVSVTVVGAVYSIALRNTWNPTGWNAVADHALHDLTPLLFVATWVAGRHGGLRWRDLLWGVAPGLAYCVYALARGSLDGWYAYWFLDPSTTTTLALARNIAGLSLAFLAVAAIFVAVDRWLDRRRQ